MTWKPLVLTILLSSGAVATSAEAGIGTAEVAGAVDEISAGNTTSCFRVGTDLYCMGDNAYHQIDKGSVSHFSVPHAMGRTVRDKRSNEWVFEPYRVESVSVGTFHVCAIFTDHKAYCWGRNTYGQLGDNSLTNALSPSQVAMPYDVTAVLSISAGNTHTCAIVVRNNRKRGVCWGQNNHGQVGGNSVTFSAVPVQRGNLPVESIYTGGEFTCVLGGRDPGLDSWYGRLYCWGSNAYGQLGLGAAGPDVLDPTPVELPGVFPSGLPYNSRARSVATGMDFMCAVVTNRNVFEDGEPPLASGHVYCVGNNRFRSTNYPQFSAGPATPLVVTSWLEQQALPNGTIVFVASSAQAKHACAVNANGDVWCWGANGNGQTGINGAKPVPPNTTDGSPAGTWITGWGLTCQENTGLGGGYPPGTPCKRGVAVGGYHTLLITTSKVLYGWGSNWWGQLGLGETPDRWVPTPIGY